MDEIKNCKKCNMLFASNEGSVLCKKCELTEENLFRAMRDYLYDHPGTSLYDLSIRFNVSIKRINRYLHDGSFSTVSGSCSADR